MARKLQQNILYEKNDPEILPVLPLRNTVTFPLIVLPITVTRPSSIRLISELIKPNQPFLLVAQRNNEIEVPTPQDIYQIGTLGMIQKSIREESGHLQIFIQGIERAVIKEVVVTSPYMLARYERLPDSMISQVEIEALHRAILNLIKRLVNLIEDLSENIIAMAEKLSDVRQLVYIALSLLPISLRARQEILEMNPFEAKMHKLIEILQHEITVRELGHKITSETKERLTKAEHDFFLREQVRSIQQELGENATRPELVDLEQQLNSMDLPPSAREEVNREIGRLKQITTASVEYGIVRTYLEWISSLPWQTVTGGSIDTQHARSVLDTDHFDLDKVKTRIIEHLAVKKLRQIRQAENEKKTSTIESINELNTEREPILCFVGPPGVGKTSLGQSIARALGRKFVRVSLGGVHDEAEIRGHRRTYIGAMPGRIIQALKQANTKDPVFMLDELDKIGDDWRGDPSAALLEVLDPAQNNQFVDHYIGVPFDLSQVLFISTANSLDTIPSALLDRMEVLRLAGYTEQEKIDIAQHHLIPKQLSFHALTPQELTFSIASLQQIIRHYTREAGVRELERKIAKVCRKVVHKVVEGWKDPTIIMPDNVKTYLGPVYYFDEVAERTERPGVATGLVWTSVGGDIIFIEATMMPSRDSKFMLTGMLGDVMRESAQAALSYVRSNAQILNIADNFFEEKIVHLHVPAGATPKDGPSAGITMITAIVSLATNRCVRGDIAMTGEITLRGKILPVGGIKEKVLAAHRAGIKTVILPKHNEVDLEEIPQQLIEELQLIFVDKCDEIFKYVLEDSLCNNIEMEEEKVE
jgi:ATP-dependent Lon protease